MDKKAFLFADTGFSRIKHNQVTSGFSKSRLLYNIIVLISGDNVKKNFTNITKAPPKGSALFKTYEFIFFQTRSTSRIIASADDSSSTKLT